MADEGWSSAKLKKRAREYGPRVPRPLTLDFETHAIQARPAYPPLPIGVSLKEHGKKPRYLAWGHASNNNTTFEKAKIELAAICAKYTADGAAGILCHNSSFDLDVLETHCGIKLPHWKHIHDTMWLLFLHDPNLKNLGLKPSAEEILGWPSDERDAVGDWLCANQPVPGVKISRGKGAEHFYMKYLAYAPGDLVGKYADGDVLRTEELFEKLYPLIKQRKMLEPYDRERRLMPVLLAMERRGVRVDLPKLRADVAAYGEVQIKVDAWLRKKLKVGPYFNLDSDEFVEALIGAGIADREKMGVTKTGKVATNKEAIAAGVTDKQVAAVLQYRAQLHTCMATFMVPWLAMAEASGGYIYSTWNQVRGEGKGARTGRLSSSPNFQNVPKTFKPLFSHEKKGLPAAPWKGLLPLPRIRGYVIPYQGDHVLVDRDFSQQEIRTLAHFGDGVLQQKYKENPWVDMHDAVKDDLLRILGLDVPRDSVKAINFGILYGMGIGSLAARLEVPVEEAKKLKDAVLTLYPEIKDLYATTRALAKASEPVVTWGGRENFCEAPTTDKASGRSIDWSYRLPNTIIQGSAADQIKEAIIRYAESAPPDHLLLLNVHDQLLASVPRHEVARGHEVMRTAMDSLELDVVMLSEGKWSERNWADLLPYDKKGVIVAQGLPEQKGKTRAATK